MLLAIMKALTDILKIIYGTNGKLASYKYVIRYI